MQRVGRGADLMHGRHPSSRGTRATSGAALSVAVSLLVAATAGETESRLGVPAYWPWLLTGLQVLALWAAGARRWWGWLLGASIQPPWIAYAMVTGQFGFIPGCLVSWAVQTYSYLRAETARPCPDSRPRSVRSLA